MRLFYQVKKVCIKVSHTHKQTKSIIMPFGQINRSHLLPKLVMLIEQWVSERVPIPIYIYYTHVVCVYETNPVVSNTNNNNILLCRFSIYRFSINILLNAICPTPGRATAHARHLGRRRRWQWRCRAWPTNIICLCCFIRFFFHPLTRTISLSLCMY